MTVIMKVDLVGFGGTSGYAVGALLSGDIADLLGMRAAIKGVAILTLLSGFEVAWRMRETLPRKDSKIG
jgi:hypothetical protein